MFEEIHALVIRDGISRVNREPQMRITRGEKWHPLPKVKNPNFWNDTCCKIDVVDIVTGLLSDQDIGFGEFEGFCEGYFGGFRVGFSQFRIGVKVV